MNRISSSFRTAFTLTLAVMLAAGSAPLPSINQPKTFLAPMAYADEQAQALEPTSDAVAPEGPYVDDQLLVELADDASLGELESALGSLACVPSPDLSEEDEAFGYVLVELADDSDLTEAMAELEALDCVEDVQANHVYHLFDESDSDNPLQETISPQSMGVDAPDGKVASLSEADETEAAIEIVIEGTDEDETCILESDDADGTEAEPIVEAGEEPLAGDASLQASDTLIHALAPNDPESDPTSGRQRDQLAAIRAYDAWETTKTDGKVAVAILDTGVDMDHPDLAANVIAEAAYNALDGSHDVADLSSHGTHVAGIAAAVADNGLGVAGVSYNARIIPVKVIRDDGTTQSFDVLRGLQYVSDLVADHPEYGLRVINMSFGGKVTKATADDQAVIRAIDALSDQGVLTVCAAGNTDASKGEVPPYRAWPGDFCDTAVSVINANGSARSGGSNYNEPNLLLKDLSAPGTNILSTVPGGDVGTKTGTSMAAPCVTGVAALLFAADPSLAPADAAALLCATAQDLGEAGYDCETGFGMVDAADALEAVTSGNYLTGVRTLAVGNSTKLTPVNADLAQNGTWASSNPDVATVDDGTVYAQAEGTAVISCTGTHGTASLVVRAYAPQLSGTKTLKEGASNSWRLQTNMPAAWTWSTSDPTVATVGSSGLVCGVHAGTATITASLSSNPDVSASAVVEVIPATIDLSAAQVTLTATAPYTGQVVTPPPVVLMGDTQLKAGVHYGLSYRNNLRPGTATVTITGKGDYSGTATKTFTIVGTLKAANVASIAARTYTGKAQKPAPSVTFGGTRLISGTNYSVSYANNTKAGTATVTIRGKGCYTGTVTKTFSIKKAANPLVVKATAKSVKLAAVRKKAVACAPLKVSKAQGKVTYAKASGSKYLTVNKSTGRVSVRKGTKAGSYTMRVKVSAAGGTNYKAGAKTVTVRVKVVR